MNLLMQLLTFIKWRRRGGVAEGEGRGQGGRKGEGGGGGEEQI